MSKGRTVQLLALLWPVRHKIPLDGPCPRATHLWKCKATILEIAGVVSGSQNYGDPICDSYTATGPM